MELSQTTNRSPHPPSCGSFRGVAGRHSPIRPHLVGVSRPKDLELLGVLPSLAVHDHGYGRAHSNSSAAGKESMMSVLRSGRFTVHSSFQVAEAEGTGFE